MIMHYCIEVTALLEFIDVDYHKSFYRQSYAIYLGTILIQLGHTHLHGSVGHI